MARDELLRSALVRDIPRHFGPLGVDALRILDAFTIGLLLHERAHGPIDLEALSRLPLQLDPHGDPSGTCIAATIQAVGIGLLRQDQDRAARHEVSRRELDQPGNREAIAEYRERESARLGATPVLTVGGSLGEAVDPDTGPIAAAAEFVEEQQATRIGGPAPYESLEIDGREIGR